MSLLLQPGQQAWSGSVPGKVGSIVTLCKATWIEATGPETGSAVQTQQMCQLTWRESGRGHWDWNSLEHAHGPHCLPLQLNSSVVTESLHLCRVQCLSAALNCVSFLQHFWMSWFEILSQGQFFPLITDSLVLQRLSPQCWTVPVVSSWASRRKDTFPTSSPSRHLTLCCSLSLDQTACSTGPEHFPSVLRTFFFLYSPSSALFPPHPFLWKLSFVPSEALMPPKFSYVLRHLLAPWTHISIGRSILHPDEASPQLDHPTFTPKLVHGHQMPHFFPNRLPVQKYLDYAMNHHSVWGHFASSLYVSSLSVPITMRVSFLHRRFNICLISSCFALLCIEDDAFSADWRFVVALHRASLIDAIFLIAFAHFVSLCHTLLICAVFQTFFYLL